MKEKKRLARFLSCGLSAVVMIQSLPVLQFAQIKAEDMAAEEALRNELLSYADEFPEGAIQFSEASGDITEGDGDREITVVRLGDPSEAMSVDVKAYDVTAQYGTDYTLYTKTILKKNYADDSQAGLPSVQEAMENGEFKTAEEAVSTETEAEGGESPTEAVTEENEEYEIVEAQAAEKEEAAAETEESGLRSAFREQTGRETVNTNWRGDYERELAEEAAKTADNEVVDSFDGAFLTLDFAPGEYKKSVWIHVIDDEKAEIEESTALILGNASSGLIAGNMQYKVNIADNEENIPITFAMKDAEVVTDRSASYAEVTVERLTGLDYYASATYRTGSGTAESYDAYTPVDGGSLSFAPGQTEHKLRIDLTDDAVTGTYFTVMLDKELNNIDETRGETRVYIGSKIADEADVLAEPDEYQQPLPQPKPNLITAVDTPKIEATETVDGVKYKTCTYTGNSNTFNIPNLPNAVMFKADCIATRSDYHQVGYYIGRNTVCRRGPDKYLSKNDKWSFLIPLNNVNSTYLKISSLFLNVTQITLYFPIYTLISTDEYQMLTGYNYSSTDKTKYSAFTVPTINDWNYSYADETIEVASDNQPVRMQNFSSARLTNGIWIEYFEVYVYDHLWGLEFIGLIKNENDGTLTYSQINNLLRTKPIEKDLVEDDDNKLYLKPRYQRKSTRVEFKNEDKAAVVLSGDKGETGFKAGDVLNCTQIDKITVKAVDNSNGQKIKVGGIRRETYQDTKYNGKSTVNYPSGYKGDQYEVSAIIDVDNPLEVITACYARPTVTLKYDDSENKSANAKREIAKIAISPMERPEETLGYSDYKTPFEMKSNNLDMLRSKYRLQGVFNDNFNFFPVQGPNGKSWYERGTVSWHYYDPDLKKSEWHRGVRGIVFEPYFGTNEVKYYFITENVDLVPEKVTGKVMINEKPLFSNSKNTKITQSPAVGANLVIGGFDVVTKADGTFETEAVFNKGDNVPGFAKYGTLTRSIPEIKVPCDPKKPPEFDLDVNINDAIKPTSSEIRKLVGSTTVNTNEIWLEDAKYYLNLSVSSTAGYTPKCAEFRVYNKFGELKDEFTKKVDFRSDKTLSYEINPTAMKLSEGGYKSLEVGDTFTVAFYDTENVKYFEHITAICIGEKTKNKFEFNFENDKKTNSSAFLRALGGIATALDYSLDTDDESSPVKKISGEGEDGKFHTLYTIGWGKEFTSEDGDKKGDEAVAAKEKSEKQADKEIGDNSETTTTTDEKDTKTTTTTKNESNKTTEKDDEKEDLTKDGEKDDMKVTESSSWSLNIKIGMVLDIIKDNDENSARKGQYYFNDFLIFASCDASYNHSWTIPIYGVNVTIKLGFSVGQLSDETDSGIRWHFYATNPDNMNERIYLSKKDDSKKKDESEEKNNIELLGWNGISSSGSLGINAKISASVDVDLVLLTIGGSLDATIENKLFCDPSAFRDTNKGIGDKGNVKLVPKIYVDTFLGKINIWESEFNTDWKKGHFPKKAPSRYNEPPTDEEIQKDILFTSTANRELNNYSELYAKRRWNGDKFMQFAPGKPESAAEITEAILQTGFYNNTDIRVQNLGNGKYIAVFIDLVPGRAESDAFGAYYSIYDGKTWSVPQLLEDDGTVDSVPTVCNAGSKGWLIVWSDASRKLDANENIGSMFNSYDLTGRFYDAENNKFGDVMEITKTGGSDSVCDASPEISYYEENGQEFMKIYYTKSEFSVSSEEEGEVVGDILNPYELKAVRNYDFKNDKWADTYFGNVKENLIAKRGEEKYKKYEETWYGQEFLTLAPTVEVEETIDEIGFWKEGTAAKVTPVDLDQTMAKDSAVITYNNLSLQAYTLDKGGMAQEGNDENLYLQIYNFQTDEYHHPILISGKNAEISDLKFIRIPLKADDGTVSEATYLYWLENSYVKRLNISNVVKNCLISAKTDAGQDYYYINKASDSEFIPEDILARPTITVNDEGEENMERFITSFKVKQNGNYNYIMWAESIQQELENEGDKPRMEQQLFAVREDTATGELTYPVQITDKKDQFISRFDFEVTDSGELDIIAGRMMLDADGKPDVNTSELTAFHVKPSDKLVITDISDAEISMMDEGDPAAEINIELENQNFNTQKNVVAEVQNEEGIVVFTSDTPFVTYEAKERTLDDGTVVFDELIKTETQRNMTMLGGKSEIIPVKIPMDNSGDYSGKLVIKVDGNVIETRELSGKLRPELEANSFTAEVSDRNEITLNASIKNNNVLVNNEEEVVYGYVDADGNKVELGKTTIDPLNMNEETAIEETAAVDFRKFISKLEEDGSLTDSLEFYMACDDFDTVYSKVDLKATASEYKLMTNLKNFDAKPSQHNFNGDLEKLESFNIGDRAYMNLWIEDDFAQNLDNYTNRTKLVWEEKTDPVASISRDGVVTANGDGTTTLNGYIVPIDTAAILYEDGTSMSIDNYIYKPSAVVIPISANVTVGDGSTAQTGNIATDEELLSWAASDYMTKNEKSVSVKTLNVSDEGKYEITLFDENDEVLDKYVIDPKTGTGVNSANEEVDLPQTGMNSIVEMLIVFTSMLMIGIGLIAVMYSRKKRDEEINLKE